jgi:hypothetical protein
LSGAHLVTHRFVDVIPARLDEGVVYISLAYDTMVHLCCCGCENEVVTPLNPFDWQLTYDGDAISISPSIGNWALKCQSHYWITRGRVHWAAMWSAHEIEEGRRRNAARRAGTLKPDTPVAATPLTWSTWVWNRLVRVFGR